MKSNTGKNRNETPFERHRIFFEEENKKIIRIVIVALASVAAMLLVLNLVSAGFGYKSSMAKPPLKTDCSFHSTSIRYYVLPGYLAGCWLGNK